jgi:pyruvate formate lyase activating enzyme
MADDFSAWALLRGFEPCSFCDWAEHVTSVLFFGGCNLRCPTCHNHELAWHPETCEMPDVPRIQETILKRRKWLDGVVVSGGEPTLVSGLEDILAWIRDTAKLPARLDSNGFRPDVLGRVLDRDLAEQIAVDVKGPWKMYPQLTGGRATPEQAEKCLSQVFDLAQTHTERFYFRCTCVPCLKDKDITAAQKLLPPGHVLHLQDYVDRTVREFAGFSATEP